MSHIIVHEETVQKDWIDYNGHMNVAFYVLVFDHATDKLLDKLGLDASYREREGMSVFVVESHVTYNQEVALDDPLLIKTWLLGVDAKRLHIFHEMYHKDTKVKCATNEIMAMHVDTNVRKTAPMSGEAQIVLQKAVADSLDNGWPEGCGRSIRELTMKTEK